MRCARMRLVLYFASILRPANKNREEVSATVRIRVPNASGCCGAFSGVRWLLWSLLSCAMVAAVSLVFIRWKVHSWTNTSAVNERESWGGRQAGVMRYPGREMRAWVGRGRIDGYSRRIWRAARSTWWIDSVDGQSARLKIRRTGQAAT
ncbi:hypothetical protein C8R44DRAFT_856440 [Mycena epipterygia]|nr:hypothetical protein C8R44DRAFT_856440 [Mycena epipterygia]